MENLKVFICAGWAQQKGSPTSRLLVSVCFVLGVGGGEGCRLGRIMLAVTDKPLPRGVLGELAHPQSDLQF